jgi:hypothetical protein
MYHGIQKFDPNKERTHLEMETGRINNYLFSPFDIRVFSKEILSFSIHYLFMVVE